MLTTTTRANQIDDHTFDMSLSLGDRRLGMRLDAPPDGRIVISGEIEKSHEMAPCRGQAAAFIVSDGRVLARDTASLTGRFALRFAGRSDTRLILELPDRSVIRVDLDPLLSRNQPAHAWLDRFDNHGPATAEKSLREVA